MGILRTRTAAFVHDATMIPVAWFTAYWLRFNLDGIPAEFWQQALSMLPVVMVVQGGLFWYYGLYRGVWRFASMPDLVRILKATLGGVAVAAAVIFILTRLQGVPRSVFVLDAILLVIRADTPRMDVEQTVKRRLQNAHVLGIVLNRVPVARGDGSAYRYYAKEEA